jgi:hypothetical protein
MPGRRAGPFSSVVVLRSPRVTTCNNPCAWSLKHVNKCRLAPTQVQSHLLRMQVLVQISTAHSASLESVSLLQRLIVPK